MVVLMDFFMEPTKEVKSNKVKRAIIYPGSFDPFTVGHQNVLEKAEKMFKGDRIMIAIGINTVKNPNLSSEQMVEFKNARMKAVKTQMTSKEVVGYIGFLTDYVREIEQEGYDEVIVVRGLRNGYDLDYEYTNARYMWDQYPGLSIVCIMCDPAYAHVSSTGYRHNEMNKKGAGHIYLAKDRPNPMIEANKPKKKPKKKKVNNADNFIKVAEMLKAVKDLKFPVELYRFGTYTQYESAGEEVNKWEEISFFDDYEIEDDKVNEMDTLLSFLNKKYIKSIGCEMYGQNVLILNDDGTTEVSGFRI